ncbi:DUF1492 domain-containing protein [Escherichia coli]|nr:DUF1492 domain-containing protein [Escherichia coli]
MNKTKGCLIANFATVPTNDGRVIAMAAGVKFGRKPHRKSVIALQFIRQKMTAEAVMNKTGISRATYYRLKKVALNPF